MLMCRSIVLKNWLDWCINKDNNQIYIFTINYIGYMSYNDSSFHILFLCWYVLKIYLCRSIGLKSRLDMCINKGNNHIYILIYKYIGYLGFKYSYILFYIFNKPYLCLINCSNFIFLALYTISSIYWKNMDFIYFKMP